MEVQTTNPSTGQPLASWTMHSPAEVEGALDRAEGAWRDWRFKPLASRAECLLRISTLLRERVDTLATLITVEMGKPITEARAEVLKCTTVCEYYASHAAELLRDELTPTDAARSFVTFAPMGAVLLIMPWNFPLWQVFRQAAPALMAGNVCVLKHAPNVWGCAAAIAGLFADAGLADGTFVNLRVGVDAVAPLIADRRIVGVALTGSERAGRAVGAAAGAAIKPAVLELGGSDPFVVLADADLDITIPGAIAGRFANAGQSCISAKRFIVERDIFPAFRDRLVDAVSCLRVGDPLEETTQVGPMARHDLRAELASQVEASIALGAHSVLGARSIDGLGFYYQPTILDHVTPGMPAFDDELFGPVATLIEADTRDHAIELANATRFGLGGSIWTTSSHAVALAGRIDAGTVMVNGIVKSDPRLPFGGIKASGIGRELARPGILTFVNQKSVWIR